MKDSIVNEVMEMVDTFLSLVTIDLEDELDRELAAAYIFRTWCRTFNALIWILGATRPW